MIQLFETEFSKQTTSEIKQNLVSVLISVMKALPLEQATNLFETHIQKVLDYVTQHLGTEAYENIFELYHLVFKMIKTLTKYQLRGTPVQI